jgi:hypothetical protein
MNETPERICEALAWLYGGEWAFDGETLYTSTDGDWMEVDEDGTPELHRDCWMRDCEEDLAHALAVTAPWEWKGQQGKVCYLPSGGRADVAAGDPHDGDYAWYLDLDGGKLSIEGECESLEMAKRTARTAYLTWMRGRLAMKGGGV